MFWLVLRPIKFDVEYIIGNMMKRFDIEDITKSDEEEE